MAILEKSLKNSDLVYINKVLFKDNSIYEGQWRLGKREGFGKMQWQDGSTYEGEWRND